MVEIGKYCPLLRGQSKGSTVMPAVGTQLELNVDTETPTVGLLPRTSHPAGLSLPLFAQDATMSGNILPPTCTLYPPPQTPPPPYFTLIQSFRLTFSL